MLRIDYAAATEKGNKPENADAADALVPEGELLKTKGIAAVICDGMSSSEGGVEAAQISVKNFLQDYFSTPDSWTVKTAVSKVLGALNRWLWSQGQMRYDSARGMVTTLTALVIKSSIAHIFHIGDSRLYLWREGQLEQLTRDHRLWVSKEKEFLSRALGIDAHIEIDYKTISVEQNDVFLFTTDGITSYLSDHQIKQILAQHESLPAIAHALIEHSLHQGSEDNVTCQLIKVLELPPQNEQDILQKIQELPLPPPLYEGMRIDGYRLLREIHASKRSEVFLAQRESDGLLVVLKTPSPNYRDDPQYLEAFFQEEWVGRRIHNPHVVKILDMPKRRFLYHILEYVPGQSLRQWINDHPQTPINTVRDYLQQIAAGLRAFHRLEMVHLDLKPENIIIDEQGLLKIIDFGSTRVAGTAEVQGTAEGLQLTVDYGAPECFSGSYSNRSDIYSLGVIAYELLTGQLPYGERDHHSARQRYDYIPAYQHNPQIQVWVDEALRKAVHPNPNKRYALISEFLYDLSKPNPKFIQKQKAPLIERDPVRFWKGLSAILLILNLVLLYFLVH